MAAAAATETEAKRLGTDPGHDAVVTIGTHNGHFHADEALAVYMLRAHVSTYCGARVVRTRDAKVLEGCHTVVDVGGVYDPEKRRFDHHQRGFETTFPGRETKLSSAGLVYAQFGKEIVRRKMGFYGPDRGQGGRETVVGIIWRKLYEGFMEALDAHDNGLAVYEPSCVKAAGLRKKFSDGGFTLGAVVERLNPNWNDKVPADPVEAQAWEDDKFEVASCKIGEEFDRELEYYTRAWWPARAVVAEAFAARGEYDGSGRIMVLKGHSVPWKDHLYTLEVEEDGKGKGKVLYVLYSEKPAPGSKWRVQCVPVSKDSFQSRKPLPESWRGVRDERLSEISGIPGGVFVHAAGFIGGNSTLEGALAMAKKALL